MAWTTPPTAVANSIFTSSMWNAGVRDNLLETAPAKATTAGRIIVTSGANQLVEREVAMHFVGSSQTVTSTTYADPTTPGPTVSVDCTFQAMVWMSLNLALSTANTALASFGVEGVAPVDSRAVLQEGLINKDDRYGVTNLFGGIAAGNWTFHVQYRSTAGTLTCGNRRLIVMAM